MISSVFQVDNYRDDRYAGENEKSFYTFSAADGETQKTSV